MKNLGCWSRGDLTQVVKKRLIRADGQKKKSKESNLRRYSDDISNGSGDFECGIVFGVSECFGGRYQA